VTATPGHLARRLRDAEGRGLVVAPGVHDMVSLRMADAMGFEALYMTGFGSVASLTGLPDAGLASYTEMVGRVQAMAGMARTPLIADADTGYGGLLNVRHTVRGYEAAGAQALQLEDQEFPKKCGHTPGRRVIPAARHGGQDQGRRRGPPLPRFPDHRPHRCPHQPGPVRSLGPCTGLCRSRRVTRTLPRPVLANMVEGGRTPVLSPQQLQDLGYRLAIFPVTALLAGAAAMQASYARLREGRVESIPQPPLMPFADMTRLMGFEDVWEFERRHAQDE